jgi:hypothetical protein
MVEASIADPSLGASRRRRAALSALRCALKLDRHLNRAVTRLRGTAASFTVLADINRAGEVRMLFAALRDAGADSILGLPTSPYVNANVLRSRGRSEVSNKAKTFRLHDYRDFDAVSVVDDFYPQNLQRIGSAVQNLKSNLVDAVAIGSLRYSVKWITQRQQLFPKLEQEGDRTRVLFLSSNPQSNIHEKEILFFLSEIARRDNLDVIIKPHTRESEVPEFLSGDLRVESDWDSSSLIAWAEIVIFVSSSVAIEAIMLKKPVLCLEFATSNIPTLARVEGVTRLRCRDDLVYALELLPDRLGDFRPTLPDAAESGYPLERITKTATGAREATLSFIAENSGWSVGSGR